MRPKKKIVFMTSQNQAGIHNGFLQNIELFIKLNHIDKVYIFAVKGRNVADNKPVIVNDEVINEGQYGPHKDVIALQRTGLGGAKVDIIYNTKKNGVKINDNLAYFHNQMLPQVVDPFRGLSPKLPRDKSFIINATKVRFEVLGTNNPKSPRIITSTGALTRPRYNLHMQTGMKAIEMHTYGFTYVEVFDDKKFHIQPVLANQNGGFAYLDKKYTSGKVSINKTKVLVLGDVHRAVMDKKAMAESRAQIRLLKPKYVVLHDYSDLSSINHHSSKDFISQISRRVKQYDELEVELADDFKYLNRLANDFKDTKFLVVDSNHHDFMDKYISNKQFLEDPQNVLFISSMLYELVHNPKQIPVLQIAFKKKGYKIPKNVKFLNHRQELRVGGKLISFHGHAGMSGSRGSPKTFEKANLKAVTGHTHSPQIYSNGAVVGHLTDLEKQYYAQGGLNKWLQANIQIDELNKFGLLILKNNFK